MRLNQTMDNVTSILIEVVQDHANDSDQIRDSVVQQLLVIVFIIKDLDPVLESVNHRAIMPKNLMKIQKTTSTCRRIGRLQGSTITPIICFRSRNQIPIFNRYWGRYLRRSSYLLSSK